MRIAEILKSKGRDVATVRPDDSIEVVVESLRRHGVGALVVSADGSNIDGIISERDVVRALADDGISVLQRPASDYMTPDVFTCRPTSRSDELMGVMTKHRIRHIPVEHEGTLVGIVSIGDIVRVRLQELREEAALLEEYIHHGR